MNRNATGTDHTTAPGGEQVRAFVPESGAPSEEQQRALRGPEKREIPSAAEADIAIESVRFFSRRTAAHRAPRVSLRSRGLPGAVTARGARGNEAVTVLLFCPCVGDP